MAFKEIIVTVKNGLQVIKLNRPTKKNAITTDMYHEIIAALEEGGADDNVVITALTGAGDYYSSGNDISTYMLQSEDIDKTIDEASKRVNKFVSAFIDYPKVLVGVVNGPAIGVAVTTLGLCDVIYASQKATFKTPFTALGLSAEGCSSYTFPKIMGTSMASELLYFNRQINAQEAKACGFVSEVFSQEQLDTEVWQRLEAYAKLPLLSMNYSKKLVRHWDKKNLHDACDAECKRLEERWRHEDCINAVLAFFQKRSKI